VSHCASFKCITCTRFSNRQLMPTKNGGGKGEWYMVHGSWLLAHENGSKLEVWSAGGGGSLAVYGSCYSINICQGDATFALPPPFECPANLLLSEPAESHFPFAFPLRTRLPFHSVPMSIVTFYCLVLCFDYTGGKWLGI